MTDVMDVKNNKHPVIVIHGGAWNIPDNLEQASRDGVKKAAKAGYQVLVSGGSALDAVTEAVKVLEDDPAFDAGETYLPKMF